MKRCTAMVTAMLAGCSVVNDPSSVRPPPEEMSHVCGDVAELMCAAQSRCCLDGGPIPGCIATAQAACAFVLASLDQPVVGYSPQIGGEVLASARRLTATCDPAITRWFNEQLVTALAGTVERGQPCGPEGYSIFACKNDLACVDQAAFGRSFTCVDRLAVGVGPCRDDRDCQHGTYCNMADLMRRCAERRPLGMACTADGQCETLTCRRSMCVEATAMNVYCGN